MNRNQLATLRLGPHAIDLAETGRGLDADVVYAGGLASDLMARRCVDAQTNKAAACAGTCSGGNEIDPSGVPTRTHSRHLYLRARFDRNGWPQISVPTVTWSTRWWHYLRVGQVPVARVDLRTSTFAQVNQHDGCAPFVSASRC